MRRRSGATPPTRSASQTAIPSGSRREDARPMSTNLYIGGRWRDGRADAFTSTDPATGEAVWRGAAASAADAFDAVAAALHAFPAWADTPLEERVALVR